MKDPGIQELLRRAIELSLPELTKYCRANPGAAVSFSMTCYRGLQESLDVKDLERARLCSFALIGVAICSHAAGIFAGVTK